jgi:hypothetical protein
MRQNFGSVFFLKTLNSELWFLVSGFWKTNILDSG